MIATPPASDGFSSSMLRSIDVSAVILGKLAKLALGRAQTVVILPFPGALDVRATSVEKPSK